MYVYIYIYVRVYPKLFIYRYIYNIYIYANPQYLYLDLRYLLSLGDFVARKISMCKVEGSVGYEDICSVSNAVHVCKECSFKVAGS